MRKYFQTGGLCGLAILVVITAVVGAAPVTPDPLAQMKQEVAEVVAVFQDPRMSLAARRAKLRNLAAQYFDFEDMAESTLGYHWRDLTAAQRAEFVPVFTAFIEDAYLSKLQDYTVRKVQEEAKTAVISFTGEHFDSADYAEVSSSIVLHDQRDPIVIGYLLHRVDGVWRVYDLTVYAISVIANYRNQFSRVIANEGFEQLVADLKAKQAQLKEYMEHPPASANANANRAEK